MDLKYKLLLLKLFFIKFFVLFRKTLVIFLVFFLYFYFATNSLKDLDFNSSMIFGIIFIWLIASFVIDLKNQLNKRLIIKYYSKKVNDLNINLQKIVKIFELNKNFVKEKINVDNIKKISDKDINSIIKFLQKNEDILLNSKLLNRYKNLKKEIEINIFDIEKLFVSFNNLELKEQIFNEYKAINKLKKEIYINIKSFDDEINNYLKWLKDKIQELINLNNKNLDKLSDVKLKSVLVFNNKILLNTFEKIKRSIKT